MVEISERIVEDYKCEPPPNHLLNTEIFWKMGCNKFIAVEPAEIYFDNVSFRSQKSGIMRQFELKNISGRVTRLHILPPDTKYFQLSYKQPKCLVPGYSITCRLVFFPDKSSYYEDCIRVHTEDHENQLIIPIYAYPVIGDFEFPEFIEFPPTNIGKKKTHHIPIKSTSTVDFEYRIQIIHNNPSFTIQPMKGVLHARQITELLIDFQPNNYSTCELKFELHIAQVNFQPKCCTVIGNALPGLESSPHSCYDDDVDDDENLSELLDTNKCEISQSLHSRRMKKSKYSSQIIKSIKTPKCENLPEITCPHHLVKFLLDSHEKLSSSQRNNTTTEGLTRQQKLLIFESMVHQDLIDEQRNQVRWQSKLGANPLSAGERIKILDSQALETYKYQLSIPTSSANFKSSKGHRILSELRPYRPVEPFNKSLITRSEFTIEPKFHIVEFTKAKWLYRCDMIEKFRSTISSIIINRRMIKRLKKLKQAIVNDKQKVSKHVTNEKYPYNIGNSIPSIRKSDCGTKLFHHQIWSERDLLCNQNVTKSNQTTMLNSSSIEPTHLLPITCIYNYNQLLKTFTTPKHYWPLFDMPVALDQYEMRYTDKFDLNLAMDYAKLIPMDINYAELLPIQQQKPQNQLSSTSQVIGSSLTCTNESMNDSKLKSTIISDTSNQSTIRLPQSIHSLSRSNMNTNGYSNNQHLPLTLLNLSTLNDYSNTLINSVNQLYKPNDNIISSSLSNSDYIDTVLINLGQTHDHSILRQWSSSSNMHKPLVPITKLSYPKCHYTSKDDNILQENELLKCYSLNDDESKSIKELVEQDIQDWIKRFPEMNSMFSMKNEYNDNGGNEEISPSLNNRNHNNPLLNLNNAPIEESKKYQNEILSVCKFKF
uniref:Cilia- and flagella-associated protein 221 n=1 Tax=Schistosoma mansoni TaxID=6183 RepID=A0A3Q0KN48_SCHMA